MSSSPYIGQSVNPGISFMCSKPETVGPENVKFYTNAVHGPRRCPIVFWSNRSKVKVTREFALKIVFTLQPKNCLT